MKQIRRNTTAALVAAALATPVSGANILWTGAVNDNWHDAANWSTNGVPTVNDTVVLAGGSPRLTGDAYIGSLLLNSPQSTAIFDGPNGYGGHQLFVAGGSIIHTAAAYPQINILAQVRLANNTVVDVQGDRELHLRSLTNGTLVGMPSLTKTGSGTLRLGSATSNLLNGNISVGGGTLELSGGSIGAGNVTVANNATLHVSSSRLQANVAVSGAGYGGMGAIRGSGTIDGNVTLSGNTSIDDITIAGNITDGNASRRLTLLDDALVRLEGNNTYDGGTVVGKGATLIGRSATAFGSGAVEVLEDGGYVTLSHDGGTFANNFILDSGGRNYGNASFSGDLYVEYYRHTTISGDLQLRGSAHVRVGDGGQLTLDGRLLHDVPDQYAAVSFRKTGTGAMVLNNPDSTVRTMYVQEGTLRANGEGTLSALWTTVWEEGTLELAGSMTYAGSLQVGGEGHAGRGVLHSVSGHHTLTQPLRTSAGTAVLAVDAGSTLGLADGITRQAGNVHSGIRKIGQGTLILHGKNQIDRDFFIDAGTVSIASDDQLGEGVSILLATGNARLFVRDSMSTARTYNFTNASIETAAGKTLTIQGIVNGATLRGPGRFHLAGGATMANATSLAGTTITQDGPVQVSNLTNMGTITNQSGTLAWDGGVNHGRLDVDSAAITSYLLNAGRIYVNDGATLTHGGSDMHSTGGSRINIASSASVTLDGVSLHLDGALLVNNGSVSGGTVYVNYGATVKGSGTFASIAVGEGGTFSPGNSPGLTQTGNVTFAPGGVYHWEINDANGLPAVQHDHWITDHLEITAGTTPNSRFTLRVSTLLANNADGPMSNFDPEGSYTWTLFFCRRPAIVRATPTQRRQSCSAAIVVIVAAARPSPSSSSPAGSCPPVRSPT